jgi:hypothetical protein
LECDPLYPRLAYQLRRGLFSSAVHRAFEKGFNPRMMMKTQQEIDIELFALHDCKARLRWQARLRWPRSVFGDDHEAAITAQIRVLTERMTCLQVTDAYGDNGEGPALTGQAEEDQMYVFEAALEAHDWMYDLQAEDLRPCGPDGWPFLCTTAEMESA